jgi:hypothetical protein
MILEGSDGALCGVGSVVVWGKQLELDMGIVKVVAERVRALVVQPMELGAEARTNEFALNCLKCFEDVVGGFGAHWYCVDGITVVVIQYKELGVSVAGGDSETAGLVCENQSGRIRRVHDGGVASVSDG